MFLKRVISYLKKNGVIYAFKSQYYQYRLEHGKGWQLCGFDIETIKKKKINVDGKIKISILVPIYNTPIDFLKEMLDSVLWQTYNNWELCIADASDKWHSSVSDVCKVYCEKESRILYRKVIKNTGIVGNTNVCLSLSTGQYIALLDHDDILHPEALESVIKEIQDRGAEMIYTDEAIFEQKLERIVSLQIKPGFSPENLRGCNYICHFCMFSRELLRQVGGYKEQFEGSQDYDMVLRLTERAKKISHIPKVLYYWRRHSGSVAEGISVKSYASEAGRKAVFEHIKRIDLPGDVSITKESEVVYRVKYKIEKEQEKMLPVAFNNDVNAYVAENANFVLLIQKNISFLNEEDIQVLETFAHRQEIGIVTGTVANSKGEILQGPNSITDEGEIMHLFKGHHMNSVSLMNRMLYAQNVEIVGAGFWMMRKELYQQYAKEMQEEKYSTNSLQKISLEIGKQGYQNIFVPWVKTVCKHKRKMDLGLKKLPVGYEGYMDKYANPSYRLLRKWIKI